MKKSATNEAVSVIMPVYNGERFLQQAVESILKQAFSDFKLYLVDDCSTDSTPTIIKNYQKLHPDKILAFTTPHPMKRGLWVYNWIIPQTKGEYVAFADADDLYDSNRLLLQYEYLQKNKDVFAVGSSGYTIDENSRVISSYSVPQAKEKIFQYCFNGIVVRNPTIMFRSEMLGDQNYYLKDYELIADWWSNASKIITGYKYANLPQHLHYYRIHDQNFSQKRNKSRYGSISQVLRARLQMIKLGFRPTVVQILRSLAYFSLAYILPDFLYKKLFDSKHRWKTAARFDASRSYKRMPQSLAL